MLPSLDRALLLVKVMGRVRLCLDFSVTLHLVHLVLTTMHAQHVPSNLFWWGLNILSCALMTIAGEWLCMRFEMEPIRVGVGRGAGEDGDRLAAVGGAGNADYGKRKKSGVSYEMLPLGEQGEAEGIVASSSSSLRTPTVY
jgi:hypothetical protein